MKINFTILLILLSLSLCAQEIDLKKKLFEKREITDCKATALNAVDMAGEKLNNHSFDTLSAILGLWTDTCGITECAQRLIVMNTIMQNKPSLEAIETYYKNDFYLVLKNRIEDTKRHDYQYIYEDNQLYYGYVPLRHSIDSIVEHHARKLLKTKSLTLDEELICTLFSGDAEKFDQTLKEIDEEKKALASAKADTIIAETIADNQQIYSQKKERNFSNWQFHDDITFGVYAGMYGPIGKGEQVIGFNPLIGLTALLPINDRLFGELSIKLRIHLNDSDFDYHALGETQTVDSDVGLFLGGSLGYHLFQTKRFVFTPKIGAGYEMVNTGIWEETNDEGDRRYYNLRTIHFTMGFSAMTPVFLHSYIGIAANYHYCPYHLSKRLETEFMNNAISFELFFIF